MNVSFTSQDLKKLSMERSLGVPASIGTTPLPPVNLTATVRNLGILIQWSDVAGVEGYNLIISSSQDMANPDMQIKLLGETTREYFHNVGNIAVTRYIAIQSFKGTRFSQLSSVVSAASGIATSSSTSPASTTYNNTETTLATLTVTTTGQTLLVIGKCVLRQNAVDKAANIRLKEDGVLIDQTKTISRNTGVGSYGIEAVVMKFSTPAAGSHTYIITGQNDDDATVVTVDNIQLMAAEIPLLTAATTPPTAPSTPPIVKQPTTYPTGPGSSGGFGSL